MTELLGIRMVSEIQQTWSYVHRNLSPHCTGNMMSSEYIITSHAWNLEALKRSGKMYAQWGLEMGEKTTQIQNQNKTQKNILGFNHLY